MHECIKIKCFLHFQGGGESRTGPVAHPGPDVALWRPGAVLRGHRLRLQPPELAAGKSCFATLDRVSAEAHGGFS